MNNALTDQIEFLNTSFHYHMKRNIVHMIGRYNEGGYQICQCAVQTFIENCLEPTKIRCALISTIFIGHHARKHQLDIYEKYLMPVIIDHFDKTDNHPRVLDYRDEEYIDILLLKSMNYHILECYFKEIKVTTNLYCELHNSAQQFNNPKVRSVILKNITFLCNKYINESL
tara:strand:+ start:119 stop:631 length:513 start_codon:yes stop_codon:yes gene_type:complete